MDMWRGGLTSTHILLAAFKITNPKATKRMVLLSNSHLGTLHRAALCRVTVHRADRRVETASWRQRLAFRCFWFFMLCFFWFLFKIRLFFFSDVLAFHFEILNQIYSISGLPSRMFWKTGIRPWCCAVRPKTRAPAPGGCSKLAVPVVATRCLASKVYAGSA